MKALTSFLKTTLVGGLLFLIPLGVIVIVLKHVMQIAAKVAAPIAAHFPVSHFAGITAVTLVAALVLLLIAFLAGLMARTQLGRRLSAWFEESILGGLPQYRMAKSMAEGLAHIESGTGMQPVLVRVDDGWQLAYRLEELTGGWVAVFLPQAPTPMSGNFLYVAAHRIRPLSISMAAAMKLVKSVGVGSQEALRGVDLGDSREG
jgi:uncharacterized membrane protein